MVIIDISRLTIMSFLLYFIASSQLTFSDPLNVSENGIFVQRGKRQYWGGEHALLQLQSWKLSDMLNFPVWNETTSPSATN